MIFSLTRFRLRPGTRALVDEWARFAHAHLDSVREIMEREDMYVEVVFTEATEGVDYLYWYSMQAEHGGAAEPFDHWFDEHHARFWRACIDDSSPAEDLTPRIVMTGEEIHHAMTP